MVRDLGPVTGDMHYNHKDDTKLDKYGYIKVVLLECNWYDVNNRNI